MSVITEVPVIPDSYKITVTDYHLCRLAFGERSAEQIYRKRISALTGWIKRKKPSYLTYSFLDICMQMACEDGEKLAKSLYAKNPKLTSLAEWGIV